MARPSRSPPGPAAAATHVVLLRGVNVGGKNMLPMKELVALLQAAGGEGVRTYIQSGNAVLKASAAVARRLPADLEGRIEARLGLNVPVILRTAQELRRVAGRHPFAEGAVEPRLLYVAFLADAPKASAVKALDPLRSPLDRFVVRGREVYLAFPNGSARSRLTTDYLDRTLGTTSTWRNWRTVQELAALLAG
jgi:uncharacterized protein (DUF1697 family)